MADSKFVYLEITGDISVEQVTSLPDYAYIFLLMGPTGAGKSSFIEALAGESHKLSISSNQLAGYTQAVAAYRLVNARWSPSGGLDVRPVYLVDTPGFCDSKISQIEVMDMVRDWLKYHGDPTFQVIIYFTPITDTRLAGSRRRTLEMLRQFLLSTGNYDSVILATTMWDTLPNEWTRTRAESNLSQLNDEICRSSYVYGSPERFMNTRSSALQVLDAPISRVFVLSQRIQPVTPASVHLYRDLHERIEGSLQRKSIVEFDLAHPSTQTNEELKDILERDYKENNETLTKFIAQLVKMGDPPGEFREAAQALRKTIAANIVPKGRKMRLIFRQWAKEPEIRSGCGSDPELLETMLAEELISSDLIDHGPPRKLDLKGLLGHLVDVAGIHRPKWLKRRE